MIFVLLRTSNEQASEENSEVNAAITGFQNYHFIEQLLFYRCMLNSNHIPLSFVFWAKMFTDDIDIKWDILEAPFQTNGRGKVGG